jgi:hypothetical protein
MYNSVKQYTGRKKKRMYEVIESKVIVDEREEVTYSIRHDDGTVVEDVSPNREEAERLAAYFNKREVSSWNLGEIAIDEIDKTNGYDNLK